MALSDDILTILFNYSAGYKLMRQKLLSPTLPQQKRYTAINQKTLYSTLARLQKRGLVENKNSLWTLTQKGKDFFQKRLNNIMPPHSRLSKKSPKKDIIKNMIIAFDIPEKYRKKRDWLRIELTLLGFSPIQKSVWFGPAPLPKNFIESIEAMHLLNYLKFFEAKEHEIV